MNINMPRSIIIISTLLAMMLKSVYADGLESKIKSEDEIKKVYESSIYIVKGVQVERKKVGYTFNGQIVGLEEGKKREKNQKGDDNYLLLTRYSASIKIDKIIKGDKSVLKPYLRNNDTEIVLEWSDYPHSDRPHIPDDKEFKKGIWCWIKPTDEHGLGSTEWLLLSSETTLSKLSKQVTKKDSAHQSTNRSESESE